MLQGLAIMPLQLVQLAVIIPRLFSRVFFTRTPRDHAELNLPQSINLGTVYPQAILIFIIGLTYSVIAPLVLIFATLYVRRQVSDPRLNARSSASATSFSNTACSSSSVRPARLAMALTVQTAAMRAVVRPGRSPSFASASACSSSRCDETCLVHLTAAGLHARPFHPAAGVRPVHPHGAPHRRHGLLVLADAHLVRQAGSLRQPEPGQRDATRPDDRRRAATTRSSRHEVAGQPEPRSLRRDERRDVRCRPGPADRLLATGTSFARWPS